MKNSILVALGGAFLVFASCEKSASGNQSIEEEILSDPIETTLFDVHISLDGDNVVKMEKFQGTELVEMIEINYMSDNTVEKNNYQGTTLASQTIFYLDENGRASHSETNDFENDHFSENEYEYGANGYLLSRKLSPGTWWEADPETSYNSYQYTEDYSNRRGSLVLLCCPIVGSTHVKTYVYNKEELQMNEDIVFYENEILGKASQLLPTAYIDDFFREGGKYLNKYSYEFEGNRVVKKIDEIYDWDTEEVAAIHELHYTYSN